MKACRLNFCQRWREKEEEGRKTLWSLGVVGTRIESVHFHGWRGGIVGGLVLRELLRVARAASRGSAIMQSHSYPEIACKQHGRSALYPSSELAWRRSVFQ